MNHNIRNWQLESLYALRADDVMIMCDVKSSCYLDCNNTGWLIGGLYYSLSNHSCSHPGCNRNPCVEMYAVGYF